MAAIERPSTRGQAPPRKVWGGHGKAAPDYQLIADASPDVTTVTGTDGVYRHASGACHALFGWRPEDLEGIAQDQFAHPDDIALVQAARKSAVAAEGVFTVTYRFRCRDGSYRWTEATCRRVKVGEKAFLVGAVRDISDRKELDATLQRQAFSDPLTGVANRAVFMDRLRQGLLRLEREGGLLAVFFLDLDRFKVINDSLGHRAGDGVLLDMAERLVGFVRPADTLARLGGDEFAVVAEGLRTEQDAVELGKRIAEAGRRPFRVDDDELVCTLSVGVATTSDSQYSAEALLQEADLALYRAKDRGRDRSELFDEDLRTTAIGRLGTERMLRRAIDERRLRVAYQPIVDLRDGRAVAVEALVRVLDPEKGLLLPESFLAVAEETGLLAVIDEFVLADAIEQAATWHARFSAKGFNGVAVNVTARHLADARFAGTVIETLSEHGLPGSCLKIEVTERVLMEASHSAMTALRLLRSAGVMVGLDDFGTGYSSLAYLRQFPLDFVKIDKSFIESLNVTKEGDAIVAAIIGLSHAVHLTVVAEGIESPAQLEVLQSLGCDCGQGFLFARPAEPRTVDEFVTSRPPGLSA
jgi:diguanylate cyclase (GGDEF)-like protein/PAS domain S-box-containing protein